MPDTVRSRAGTWELGDHPVHGEKNARTLLVLCTAGLGARKVSRLVLSNGSEAGDRLDQAFANGELHEGGGRIDPQVFHHAVLVERDRAR